MTADIPFTDKEARIAYETIRCPRCGGHISVDVGTDDLFPAQRTLLPSMTVIKVQCDECNATGKILKGLA